MTRLSRELAGETGTEKTDGLIKGPEKEPENTLEKDKQQLRSEMKLLRKTIPEQEKRDMDRLLCHTFLQLPEIIGAHMVYCYVSCGTEPDTRSLIAALLERRVSAAVPRVSGNQMEFYQITGEEDLIPGYMGILEPAAHCGRAEDEQAPVLVPGLAFTEGGQRVGYGGGFYDRFLEREPGHLRVAFAYPSQIVKAIPAGLFDQGMDRIITPYRVIETGGRIRTWN